MEQVVVNLVQNAIDSIRAASSADREIELSVGKVRGMAEVTVRIRAPESRRKTSDACSSRS